MPSNRWINLKKTPKKQENSFEAVIHRIQNLNILEKMCNVRNRYDLHTSPTIIFKHNRRIMEEFAKVFYKAFIFVMIPMYKEERPLQSQQLSLQLKAKYVQISSIISMKKASYILEFYSFLICLVSKGVMDYAADQTLQTDHLFKKRNQTSQRIQTAEIAFIFLTYETLGLKIGVAAFSVLFKRYIRSETIKQSLFDLGKICLNVDFIQSLSKPKRKTQTQHDMLRLQLHRKLNGLDKDNQQKKRKAQRFKTCTLARESIQDIKIPAAVCNSALNQVMKGNQVSTSFNFYNKGQFGKQQRTPKINMSPINFERINKMSKRRARHMTQLRLTNTSKNDSPKPIKKCDIQYWKQQIRKMKQDSSKRISCQDFSLNRKQATENIYQTFQSNKNTCRASQARIDESKKEYVSLFQDKNQVIQRCQMGLVVKIQNYPCPPRKSHKKIFGTKPSQLRNQLKYFSETCRNTEQHYKENTVNQMLSRQAPYIGKKKKKRRQSNL